MKKESKSLAAIALFLFSGFYSYGQSGANYYPGTGNVGFGTTSATSNFNLQLHGTTDYTVTFPAVPPVYDRDGNLISPGQAGHSTNYGRTARLGLTNTTSGFTSADGMLIRMSGLNGVIENQEKQNLSLISGNAMLTFSGTNNRAWFGNQSVTPTAATNGYLNVITADNGLYIKNNISGKFGLSIQPYSANDIGIQVTASDGTRHFVVQGNGNVFARKYTTTLANIPDYVFQPTYQLMPLNELKEFIRVNSHLPNVPSAAEYAETGVDLGEMNRVLLEKVEELTLYILQMEDRLKSLEEKK
ncbi:hypothetical protein D3C87_262430 [compost metagenome]